MLISVVIPVFNEKDSVAPLTGRLLTVLTELGTHEVVFINDGSNDGTGQALEKVRQEHPEVIRVIHLRTNCGKAIALQTGFSRVRGDLVVMMDGDLQDQPEEIPKLLETMKLNGWDAVTGWKISRQDPILKIWPSRVFNLALNWLSKLNIHDYNCGLKVFRRECLSGLNLHGQMHRFIMLFIARHGFKVGEAAVEHAPRLHGESKYGLRRLFHGLMDFLTVFFITRYLESPLYFFGFYGLCAIGLSIPVGAYFIILHFHSWLVGYADGLLPRHPLWIISPVLFLLGLIMIFFGLLGQMITHHLISPHSFQGFIERETGPADSRDDSRS
ncbi:MAG: glycosyltransferase family 2 protein [Thermodesulfobacteriota bacterium]